MPARSLALTVALVAFLALTRPSSARDDDPAPVPSDPVFKALRIDGTTVSGRIKQVGPNSRVVLVEDAAETAILFADLVKLTRDGDPPASPPDGPVVLFPGGDRLRAQIGASNDTALEVHAAVAPDAALAVPVESLLALLLNPPSDASAQEAILARLRDEPRKSEVMLTVNDDRQVGGFLGLESRKVRFQRENGPPEIDRARVAALEFDPAVANYPEPKGAFPVVTFLDGSRLGAKSLKLESGQVVAETRFGATLRVPIANLARIHIQNGRVAYLSDRKETDAVFIGYLGSHRKSYGRDRTADGRTLKLGGEPFDRGIGTQSRTLLAYRLAPGDKRFQATVGLDDRAGALGSVVFRVLVDGKERFASPAMTGRDGPKSVDVDLSGARLLILATEFGERGDVQDLADWAEARIIRE